MKIKGWDQEYEVKIKKSEYISNGNLAVSLMCYDDEFNFWGPYGTLTQKIL